MGKELENSFAKPLHEASHTDENMRSSQWEPECAEVCLFSRTCGWVKWDTSVLRKDGWATHEFFFFSASWCCFRQISVVWLVIELTALVSTQVYTQSQRLGNNSPKTRGRGNIKEGNGKTVPVPIVWSSVQANLETVVNESPGQVLRGQLSHTQRKLILKPLCLLYNYMYL